LAKIKDGPKFKETLWEWRAFAIRVESNFRQKILSLPKKHGKPLILTDRYIFRIGSNSNIKIRGPDLRIKRIAKVSKKRIALWTTEAYSFPISAYLFNDVTNALNISLPKREVKDGDQLVSILSHATPLIRIVNVVKHRELRVWPPSNPEGVIIELAEINVPEKVNSVSIEHRDLKKVNEAVGWLRLPGPSMKVIYYTDCIKVWAEGRSLFE